MPLTVLSIGYPLAPVAENTAGGAEQILALLDEQLVAAGHRSLVIAPEGSRVRGTLNWHAANGAQHRVSAGASCGEHSGRRRTNPGASRRATCCRRASLAGHSSRRLTCSWH